MSTVTESYRKAEESYHASLGVEVEERFVEVPDLGIRARYFEVGSGPPVLMVHGGGAMAAAWAPLVPHLDGFRLIIPDRPGCGLSEGFDYRGVDLRDHAVRFLRAVLDHALIEVADVVANSMGGLWSLWLAQACPDRVRRLALLGTPARLLETSAPFGMRLLGVPGLNRLMMRLEPPNPGNVRKLWRRMGHDPDRMCPPEMVELMVRSDQLPRAQEAWLTLLENVVPYARINPAVGFGEEDLEALPASILYIWGENDPFGSLEVARRAQRATPGSRLEVIGEGHLPWLDDPEGCGRAVRAFFGEGE